MMDKWRKPTEEEAKRSGGCLVPNEDHPEWKAAFGKMAESIYDKIDAEILAKFNRPND